MKKEIMMCNFIPKLLHTYHGFLLEKTESLEDIRSTGYLFRHIQSGARLLYLKNNDKNKVFTAGFKTPPENSCGTPHILEHSVLCGSRKYTAKDPFNELAKGSLNTFLNAMTYADKTLYPVASCNEKDLHNLMDVYLDAVFFPKIYEKKEIFQQEGWRYVLENAEAPLEITGVVYNEMKGALSDPESLLSSVISSSIFGETVYGFESGGDPVAIPDLTYDDFLKFHQKYYHPSNAYLYLYGDMDWNACLKHIDSYLSMFQCSADLPTIADTAFVQREAFIEETYPVSEEGASSGCYLAYNWKVGHCTDPERIMAMQILSYILLETNASPLKNALLEKKVCEETEGWFDSSCYEMVFSIIAKNADPRKRDIFLDTIKETLHSLEKTGISAVLLETALQKYEFLLLEEDFGSTPKGLVYYTRLMKSWLHGKDPFESLHLGNIFRHIKLESKNGYFETLICKILSENRERTFVQFEPEKGKGEKDAEIFQRQLEKKKEEMTAEDKNRILEENKNLELFQTQEESIAVLAQIPQLELSEISRDPMLTEYHTGILGGNIPLLFAPLESGRIIYWKLHFDSATIPQDLLPYAGLLTELLGKLDTKCHSFQELPTVINECFGGFGVYNDIYNKNAAQYRSFVTVKGKLLQENIERALQLTEEILLRTKFDKIENLKTIVKSAKIRQENYLLNHPHYIGIFYCGSHLFEGLQAEDAVSGIRYYRFLCMIDKQLTVNPAPIVAKLEEVSALLFCRNNFEISIGCEKLTEEIKSKFDILAEHLPQKSTCSNIYNFAAVAAKDAFSFEGGVVYNIQAFDLKKYGFVYQGAYQVLRTIIDLEYLWNFIRVQGGAYGCGCQFQRSGFSYFYSFRDPNLENTYKIYQQLWLEISNFNASEHELVKYILGTINRLDQPKTNAEKLNAAINQHYKGISANDLIQERQEILNTSVKDIQNCAALLKIASLQENICTIGSSQIIQKNSEMFYKIEPLI